MLIFILRHTIFVTEFFIVPGGKTFLPFLLFYYLWQNVPQETVHLWGNFISVTLNLSEWPWLYTLGMVERFIATPVMHWLGFVDHWVLDLLFPREFASEFALNKIVILFEVVAKKKRCLFSIWSAYNLRFSVPLFLRATHDCLFVHAVVTVKDSSKMCEKSLC